MDRWPRPIDVHVGARIRLRRTLLAMSQEQVGDALGLTFQQVEKYEHGITRVDAPRLFDLSRILDVPISFFFDDTPDSAAANSAISRASADFSDAQDMFDGTMSRLETVALVRAYYRITNSALRNKVFELIKSMEAAEG
jgi:transcriptional regulator with XRE-family HTH domain